MRKILSLALVLILAAGCAERWARPGGSEAEGEQALEFCRQQSFAAVPQVYETRMTSPARIERDRHCTRDSSGREHCRVTERRVPAQWSRVDVNESPRNEWRRNCMAANGFQFLGFRPLRLE